MSNDWIFNEYDRKIRSQLSEFLPEKIIDVRAHLYRISDLNMSPTGANFVSHAFVNGSKAENDKIILNEMLLELLYEGKFWWDNVRINKTTKLVPSFRENPSHTYKILWPIGLNVLSLEPKVIQNPGYQDN